MSLKDVNMDRINWHYSIPLALLVVDSFFDHLWEEWVNPHDYDVTMFSNCREQGFSISSHERERMVCIAQQRNSDCIVVFYGAWGQFNIQNIPDDSAGRKEFDCDEIENAVLFIYDFLSGTAEEGE